MTPKFALSPADLNSPLWQRLKAHFGAEIDRVRGLNDDEKLTEAQTAMHRGHIKCLKSLIALEKQPPRDGN